MSKTAGPAGFVQQIKRDLSEREEAGTKTSHHLLEKIRRNKLHVKT